MAGHDQIAIGLDGEGIELVVAANRQLTQNQLPGAVEAGVGGAGGRQADDTETLGCLRTSAGDDDAAVNGNGNGAGLIVDAGNDIDRATAAGVERGVE